MTGDHNRERGVLNTRQRRYLRDDPESDIDEKSAEERSIRQSIRDNVRNAVLDFPILLRHMEWRDVEGVGAENGLKELVAFAYMLAEAAGLNPEELIDSGRELARTDRAAMIRTQLRDDPASVTLGDISVLALESGSDVEEEIDRVSGTILEAGSLGTRRVSNPEELAEGLARVFMVDRDTPCHDDAEE